MVKLQLGSIEIHLTREDIVAVEADAIVNASNTRLHLGHGVSGAIKRAAGPGLQREMYSLAPIPETGITETGAYGLKHVGRILHVPSRSGKPAVIRRAYANVLERSRERGFHRVVLPSLGTGARRGALSATASARLLAEALVQHHADHGDAPGLELIVTIPGPSSFEAYRTVLLQTEGITPL